MTGPCTFMVGYTEPDREFATLDALALYLVDRLAVSHPGLDVACVQVRLDPMVIPGAVAVAIRLPTLPRPERGAWPGADIGYVVLPSSKKGRYADQVCGAILAMRAARDVLGEKAVA